MWRKHNAITARLAAGQTITLVSNDAINDSLWNEKEKENIH